MNRKDRILRLWIVVVVSGLSSSFMSIAILNTSIRIDLSYQNPHQSFDSAACWTAERCGWSGGEDCSILIIATCWSRRNWI